MEASTIYCNGGFLELDFGENGIDADCIRLVVMNGWGRLNGDTLSVKDTLNNTVFELPFSGLTASSPQILNFNMDGTLLV